MLAWKIRETVNLKLHQVRLKDHLLHRNVSEMIAIHAVGIPVALSHRTSIFQTRSGSTRTSSNRTCKHTHSCIRRQVGNIGRGKKKSHGPTWKITTTLSAGNEFQSSESPSRARCKEQLWENVQKPREALQLPHRSHRRLTNNGNIRLSELKLNKSLLDNKRNARNLGLALLKDLSPSFGVQQMNCTKKTSSTVHSTIFWRFYFKPRHARRQIIYNVFV